MIATMLAVIDPGEEVIVFEPYYENYGPDAILSGASMRYVTLYPPGREWGAGDSLDWRFDPDELRAAFNEKTKAIIINTPHNPTGKVFTREELRLIADLCIEYDALALTDEIYEHIWYPDAAREIRHVSIATLDGMRDRTVTINSLSKTYSVTGWRGLRDRRARSDQRHPTGPRFPNRRLPPRRCRRPGLRAGPSGGLLRESSA